MKIRDGAVPVALLAALLAVGTAFGAVPAFVPDNPGHSHHPDVTASARPSDATGPRAGASTGAEASERPEASAKPEASEKPEASANPNGGPSDREIAAALAELQAAGITATADQLHALASQVGLGGAVRVLVYANASGKTPDEILALFQAGEGWGQIAADLGLTVGPGIGGVVSSGHGNPHASPSPSPAPAESAAPGATSGTDHGHGQDHSGGRP